MPKFALKKIEIANGSLEFFELLIDDISLISEFEGLIEGNKRYMIEYGKIQSYIEFVSNNPHKSNPRFKRLKTNEKEGNLSIYEFKTKQLRLYCHKNSKGAIVIIGGIKKEQKTDINKLKSIVKEYKKSNENN